MMSGRAPTLALLVALSAPTVSWAQGGAEPWRYLMRDGSKGYFIRSAPASEPRARRFNILEVKPNSPTDAEWSVSTASFDCATAKVRFEGGNYYYAAGHHYGWAPEDWAPISGKSGWWYAQAYRAACLPGYQPHRRLFSDQNAAMRAFRAGEIDTTPAGFAPSLDTSGRAIVISYVRDRSERVTIARWTDSILAGPLNARRIVTETFYKRLADFSATQPTSRLVVSSTYDCQAMRLIRSRREYFDAANISTSISGDEGGYGINISNELPARLACGLVEWPDIHVISDGALAEDLERWRALEPGKNSVGLAYRSDSLLSNGAAHGPGLFTTYGLLEIATGSMTVVLYNPLARPSPAGHRPIEVTRYLLAPGRDPLRSPVRTTWALDADCPAARTKVNREETWSLTAILATGSATGQWTDNASSPLFAKVAAIACESGKGGLYAVVNAVDYPVHFPAWIREARSAAAEQGAVAPAVLPSRPQTSPSHSTDRGQQLIDKSYMPAPYGRWGMTQAEVLTASDGAASRSPTSSDRIIAEHWVAGIRFKVTFVFAGKWLDKVVLTPVDEKFCETIVPAMRRFTGSKEVSDQTRFFFTNGASLHFDRWGGGSGPYCSPTFHAPSGPFR